ncbi:MAG TPA: transglutaminase-like domain-containing protein [Bacteroidales bacterium]|nr:transglutaminase-like domain-containing protein [Bacteroidales bacterium]
MKRLFLFVVIWGLMIGSAPLFSQVLMQDKVAFDNMNKLFSDRKAAFGERLPELFSIVEKAETPELAEATRFLIAYAPLSDIANLSPDYFKSMAELALRTRSEFSWGKSIPAEVFMHFVLPFRVNNENPDTARAVFLPELKARVQGMSMYEAALEVNHWCHEKVAYRSTDERTSAPLSTIKTAYGRCGEESTFTVTAMRSIGIPARQVYTPRWVHTDDNHAWVEVWVDGKWYFMGACEPDPELNMGWFSGPATRAIMVHTNTFGQYNGPEKTLLQKPLYSKLNLLSNYAPVKKATVKVVDTDGKPIEGIIVDYQVYNYSEFYSFASLKTGKDGRCSIETAFGDLMIWVTNGKEYTWKPFPAEQESELEIIFDAYAFNQDSSVFAFQILPPSLGKTVTPATSKKEENDRRLKEEDSIRAAYEATFPDTVTLRGQYKNDRLGESMVNFILKSRGNFYEISAFYKKA